MNLRYVVLKLLPKAGVRPTQPIRHIVTVVEPVEVVKKRGFAILDLPVRQLAAQRLGCRGLGRPNKQFVHQNTRVDRKFVNRK